MDVLLGESTSRRRSGTRRGRLDVLVGGRRSADPGELLTQASSRRCSRGSSASTRPSSSTPRRSSRSATPASSPATPTRRCSSRASGTRRRRQVRAAVERLELISVKPTAAVLNYSVAVRRVELLRPAARRDRRRQAPCRRAGSRRSAAPPAEAACAGHCACRDGAPAPPRQTPPSSAGCSSSLAAAAVCAAGAAYRPAAFLLAVAVGAGAARLPAADRPRAPARRRDRAARGRLRRRGRPGSASPSSPAGSAIASFALTRSSASGGCSSSSAARRSSSGSSGSRCSRRSRRRRPAPRVTTTVALRELRRRLPDLQPVRPRPRASSGGSPGRWRSRARSPPRSGSSSYLTGKQAARDAAVREPERLRVHPRHLAAAACSSCSRGRGRCGRSCSPAIALVSAGDPAQPLARSASSGWPPASCSS